MTIEDAFETTRAMTDLQSNSIFVSPNGRRYLLMLIRGDISHDRIAVSLVVGGLESLEGAAQIVTVASFFTDGLSTSEGLTRPGLNVPEWLDNDRVALYWEDDRGVRQVVSIDVSTREIRYLTQHATDVTNYALSRQGGIVYSARLDYSGEKERSSDLRHGGFTVSSPDAIALLNLLNAGSNAYQGTYALMDDERFVSSPGHPQARRIAVAQGGVNRYPNAYDARPQFSPDGRWAIVAATPSDVPDDWDKYTQSFFKEYVLRQYRANPDRHFARQVRQLFVIDVEHASGKALWDAPTQGDWTQPTLKLAWSPDSRAVLVGPTFMPVERADRAGIEAKAVAEVDVVTGRYRQLPVSAELAAGITGLRWLSDSLVELTLDHGTPLRYKKRGKEWVSTSVAQRNEETLPKNSRRPAPIHVELRQDLNTPPALYAREDATGRERLLLDLNPRLKTDVTLGRVELVHWKAPDGGAWTGRLYYPVNYTSARRYPLVVQTYGYAPATEFSLYGPPSVPNLGPGWTTYIAQALANRDIAVLQVGGPDGGSFSLVNDKAMSMLITGREAGVRHLDAMGLIDSAKVGLQGFSQMGRQIEYAIAFSEFPYAAAIVADHARHSYFTSVLYDEPLTDFPNVTPFGEEGLKTYLNFSPAFHAERIRTPLQIQYYRPGFDVLSYWEMYSRLRSLQKPVELYVIPDIEHGTHVFQNPIQVLATQNRALDWWCFWLKGDENPSAAKVEQYSQWRKLRVQQAAVMKEARPPVLEWSAR